MVVFRGACESGVLVEVKKNCEGLGRELRVGVLEKPRGRVRGQCGDKQVLWSREVGRL